MNKKRVLILRPGQLLVFYSNIAHYGSISSFDSCHCAPPSKLSIWDTIDVEWFTGAAKNEVIPDLSLYAGLQNRLSYKSVERNYIANIVEVRVSLKELLTEGKEATIHKDC